jgi:hypothetical protein
MLGLNRASVGIGRSLSLNHGRSHGIMDLEIGIDRTDDQFENETFQSHDTYIPMSYTFFILLIQQRWLR